MVNALQQAGSLRSMLAAKPTGLTTSENTNRVVPINTSAATISLSGASADGLEELYVATVPSNNPANTKSKSRKQTTGERLHRR
jgi:hypothetical protein